MILKNPSKSGYLCEIYESVKSGGTIIREPRLQSVLIANTREEAAAIVNKTIGNDPKYTYSLKYILIFS
jgi:hypothetical protein